jgi:hypothetical protein
MKYPGAPSIPECSAAAVPPPRPPRRLERIQGYCPFTSLYRLIHATRHFQDRHLLASLYWIFYWWFFGIHSVSRVL